MKTVAMSKSFTVSVRPRGSQTQNYSLVFIQVNGIIQSFVQHKFIEYLPNVHIY